MIVKLLKDTELESRVFLAGQSHEFSDSVAKGLIDAKAAIPEMTMEYGGNPKDPRVAPIHKKRTGKKQ